MSLFKKIVSILQKQENTNTGVGSDGMHEAPRVESRQIGNTEPICPYCNAALTKMPGRKTKCPNCGNFMFVRTRPSDQRKVLVTEQQAEQIEEQWSIVNGTHAEYVAAKQVVADETATLTHRFGQQPSENDVRWSLLNKELLTSAQDRNFGLYRNSRFDMGEILRREKKLDAALDVYLEVCYIDLNGPVNAGPGGGPIFSKQEAFLAPGVIDRVVRAAVKLQLTPDQIKDRYMNVAATTHEALRTPVSPSTAWTRLQKEIDDARSEDLR